MLIFEEHTIYSELVGRSERNEAEVLTPSMLTESKSPVMPFAGGIFDVAISNSMRWESDINLQKLPCPTCGETLEKIDTLLKIGDHLS